MAGQPEKMPITLTFCASTLGEVAEGNERGREKLHQVFSLTTDTADYWANIS
jgi:hypothetical protein